MDGAYSAYEDAHEGVVIDPSMTGACVDCHEGKVASASNSLHTNLWGYKEAIEKRCDCEYDIESSEGFGMRCAGCHTGCGECHISRPNSVGGGLIAGHVIKKTPHMAYQCEACHGSRIANDYEGHTEGNQMDIHRFRGKNCFFCHSGQELHGDGMSQNASGHYEHRYEVETMPRCEDCHSDTQDANSYHEAHWGGTTGVDLQCQVCHSQPYKNCTTCHPNPAGSDSGFTIHPSVVQLKIGQNTLPDLRSEYDYVIVRHVPVDPDSTYNDPMWGGSGLDLDNFNDVPTWKYASPHNVIRNTTQCEDAGGGCGSSCHDNADTYKGYYLREVDLLDALEQALPDYDANLPVVIEEFH
jgi:hypothetical protein